MENSAEPAASPSSPSIRLKALVMPRTHRIVSGKLTKPGKMVSAEQHRKVENAKSARKQNDARQHLDQKLEVRPYRMQIVVQAQQENQKAGHEDGKNALNENPRLRRGIHQPTSPAIPMLKRNARKIATPPRRGSGRLCKCRSRPGPATQPRAIAKSRIYRVRTNEASTEAAKIPR